MEQQQLFKHVETNSPVICKFLLVQENMHYLRRYMAQGAVEYAKELNGKGISIVLHLDHGDTLSYARTVLTWFFFSNIDMISSFL